jgi:hypothetical protein
MLQASRVRWKVPERGLGGAKGNGPCTKRSGKDLKWVARERGGHSLAKIEDVAWLRDARELSRVEEDP